MPRALLLAALLVAAAQADDPATIPPAALQKAEAVYRDTYRESHEKATRTTKAAVIGKARTPARKGTLAVVTGLDLFNHFGAGLPIVGLGFGTQEDTPTLLGGFRLGSTPLQVRRAVARGGRE